MNNILARRNPLLSRRQFLWSAVLGTPTAAVADAIWLEPEWIKLRNFQLSTNAPTHRFVHLTDIHHKGDRVYLERIVQLINEIQPDFICFTGDLIEEAKHLPEALEVLRGVRCPIYGCPGNHDYWSHVDFAEIEDAFAATGGAWLVDRWVRTIDRKICVYGAGEKEPSHLIPDPKAKNIALVHYPAWADNLAPKRFHIILAGHTHGGQVRLPGVGALTLPWGTGAYDLGMFDTAAGPLYVSSGIGWFALKIRFLCRPEIVLFEI